MYVFKVKFITEFISAIKNAKNVNLKGIESLEMAINEKNGFFDFLIFFWNIWKVEKEKPQKVEKIPKNQ